MGERRCRNCEAVVESSTAAFCSQCGSPLGDSGARQRSAVDEIKADPSSSGENKHLTVLFADIKGSTEAAAVADPEEWFAALERFHNIAVEAVTHHGGVITSYAGDGVMAIFGAPVAHEHHAEQACLAALRLVERAKVLADEVADSLGTRLGVRVGINSGRVVVGRVGEEPRVDYTAQGVPVHVAARMEQIGEPGQIFVAPATADLVAGTFVLADVGERSVKGVAEPILVRRLVGRRTTTGPTPRRSTSAGSSLVGRSVELDRLREALADAASSVVPVAVLVTAVGGSGKSHLVRAFVDEIAADHVVVTVVGDTVAEPEPFWGVSRLLLGLLGLESATDRASVADALSNLGVPISSAEIALSVLASPGVALAGDSASVARRLVDEMLSVVAGCRAVGAGTLVIVIDDLHGVDRTSQAAFGALSQAAIGAPVLIVVATRPDEPGVIEVTPDYRHRIDLEPLGSAETDSLVRQLLAASDAGSLDELTNVVFERSGGNPFFVEEMLRTLVETGQIVGDGESYRLVAPIDPLSVPARVETVVTSRLDRLSRSARELAFTASAIGLVVDETLLRQATDLDGAAFETSFAELTGVDLMRRSSSGHLEFRHRIIQEVAYATQLRDRRRRVHAAVAAVLEARSDRDRRPGEIARHHDLSGAGDRAVVWYVDAARVAAFTDPSEAARLLHRVRTLTPAGATDLVEAGLLARSDLLLQGARSGIAGADVAAIIDEIRSMASGQEQAVALAIGLLRGWIAFSAAGHSAQARECSRAAVVAADATGIDAVSVGARLSEINNCNASGSVPRALALCDEADVMLARSGFDGPDSSLRANLDFARGSVLVRAGRASEALGLIGSSIATSDRLNDTMWRVVARSGFSVALLDVGDLAQAEQAARTGLELARRTCGTGEVAMALFAVGRLCVATGELDEAIAALAESLHLARTANAKTSEEAVLAELGDAYRLRGELTTAEALCREALLLARERGNDNFEIMASLALARVLLAAADGRTAELDELVATADRLVSQNGVAMLRPAVDELRSRVAVPR